MITNLTNSITPAPQWIDYMHPGETDGRSFICTDDLGPFGDTFTSMASITTTITRQDQAAITANDLTHAGAAWPDSLDATLLIPQIGLTAPAGSAGVTYVVKISALTTQGRQFVGVALIKVAAY